MNQSSLTLLYLDDSGDQILPVCARFMGLNIEQFDYPNWLQNSQNLNRLSCPVMILGQCSTPVAIDRMVAQMVEAFPAMPLLLNGLDQADAQLVSEKFSPHLMGTLHAGFDREQLVDLLHRAQVFLQQGPVAKDLTESSLLGVSDEVVQVRAMIAKVAQRDVSVLITGESGTGKEVVARNLHDQSSRKSGPFVPINCGAIPAELLESELFGHEKGAFTGAVTSRPGRFEMANGGTLFLDEIGDMPLNMQVKILRVIQERKFERVGGTKTLDTDVRIIAATHKLLEQMIEVNEFREDLYFRLNVFPIEMTPLRERVEDIPVLLEEMVRRADEQGLGRVTFHPSALKSLQSHPWPGNVRELSNLVERLVIMYPDGIVGVSELPAKFRHVPEPDPHRYQIAMPFSVDEGAGASVEANPEAGVVQENQTSNITPVLNELPDECVDLKAYLETQERGLIEQALVATDGVVARAADKLSIRRTTLVEKMRKYNIQRKST